MRKWPLAAIALALGALVLLLAVTRSREAPVAESLAPLPEATGANGTAAPAPPGAAGPRRAPDSAGGDAQEPVRVGYARGSESAPVVVVEFSDFGCPYCATFARETYPALHEEFVESGRVRWVYVPFVMGMFPNGGEAALAAECAAEQGDPAFWRMHDRLFETQRQWRATRDADSLFADLARRDGLDEAAFGKCYAARTPAQRIAFSNLAADQSGVRATPTFFVNGRPVQGALPLEQFRMLLRQLLGE